MIMEKIIVKEEVYVYMGWFQGVTLTELKENIKTLEELGITYIELNVSELYGNDVTCYKERLETDEEFNKRLELQSIRAEKQKERDLATLKALKEKYENHSTGDSDPSIH